MAQKANPISLRVRKNKCNFDSVWFNHYNYVNLLIRDFKIKKYINYILKKSNFSTARFLILNYTNKIKINVFFCDNHKAINKSYILKNIYKSNYLFKNNLKKNENKSLNLNYKFKNAKFRNSNTNTKSQVELQKFKTKKNVIYKKYTLNNLKHFKILNYLNNIFYEKNKQKNIHNLKFFSFFFSFSKKFKKTFLSNKQNIILNNYINFVHYKHKLTEMYIKYLFIKYFSNKNIKMHNKLFLYFNNILFIKKKYLFTLTYHKMQNLHIKNIFLFLNKKKLNIKIKEKKKQAYIFGKKNILEKKINSKYKIKSNLLLFFLNQRKLQKKITPACEMLNFKYFFKKENIKFIENKKYENFIHNNYYNKFYKILYLYTKIQCIHKYKQNSNINNKKFFLYLNENYARLINIKINNYLNFSNSNINSEIFKRKKQKNFVIKPNYIINFYLKKKKLEKYISFIIKMHFNFKNANLFLNNNFIYFEKLKNYKKTKFASKSKTLITEFMANNYFFFILYNKYINNSILNNAFFKKTYKNYVHLYKAFYFKYKYFSPKSSVLALKFQKLKYPEFELEFFKKIQKNENISKHLYERISQSQNQNINQNQRISQNLRIYISQMQSLNLNTEFKVNTQKFIKQNIIYKKKNKNLLPLLCNKKIFICGNYINHINVNIYNSFLCNNTLQFFKTNNFFQNAVYLMDIIIYYMEKKIPFFKLKNIILKKLIMQKKLKIKGLKVMCSGRVGGKSKKAQKAKIQSFKYGETSLNIFSSKIDFFCKHANTSFGSLGIKIWICYI